VIDGSESDADAVEIVDYDARWPGEYEDAAGEIRAALAPWILEVAHIGSTAVPGLPAKPVIDMLVGVKELSATPDIVVALQDLDYEYVPALEVELPFRRYFRRWANGRRTHQIHLVERSNTEWWDRHIAFRDWLRAHPDDRDRYAALKRSLAAAYRWDRLAYTDAKTEFVGSIVNRSRLK
jgi:GrpB-like predicted nucleotidyltransferase (UPF0157 family)